jgi:hypothetical protein
MVTLTAAQRDALKALAEKLGKPSNPELYKILAYVR